MISKITAIIMSVVALISNLSGILPSVETAYFNVEYGSDKQQIMDVYFPSEYEKTEGIVLFIHGGAWIAGDKGTFKKRALMTSRKVNCITATMNYRLASDKIHCDDMLKDITSAIKKLVSMAETRGIKCENIMLVGYSAGGHLALLYAYTQQKNCPLKISAVTSYSGPADFTSKTFSEGLAGNSEEYTLELLSKVTGKDLFSLSKSERNKVLYKYSPIKYVSNKCVPTLVVQGTNDHIVLVEDIRIFVEKLKNNRVTYKYYELPDSGHNLSNDDYLFSQSEAVFVDFINMYIK